MRTEPVVIGVEIRKSWAGVVALACTLLTLLAACELGEDTRFCLNRPVLSGFEIVPDTLYASFRADTVRFAVEASDVIGVIVTVESPTGLWESCYADTLVVGLWRCKVLLPQPPEIGTWFVLRVFLDDTGLGEFCTGTVITGAQLRNAGYPASFVVRD